jgi:hypothetical protein
LKCTDWSCIGQERAIKLINRTKIKRFDRFINEVRALKTLVGYLVSHILMCV